MAGTAAPDWVSGYTIMVHLGQFFKLRRACYVLNVRAKYL